MRKYSGIAENADIFTLEPNHLKTVRLVFILRAILSFWPTTIKNDRWGKNA
jgi:hypothetical protein